VRGYSYELRVASYELWKPLEAACSPYGGRARAFTRSVEVEVALSVIGNDKKYLGEYNEEA